MAEAAKSSHKFKFRGIEFGKLRNNALFSHDNVMYKKLKVAVDCIGTGVDSTGNKMYFGDLFMVQMAIRL
ncbi:hypothetical protein LCGC14_0145180 [marine sediment metagenome]|uniref:Uncharacterized protein n=1 Tax=marine sediment metagenome TaxID=412755 RepID=A0A0F9XH84_9ZZZZ